MPRTVQVSIESGDWRDRAIEALHAGGVVMVPTDTVYALAALPADSRALRRLLQARSAPEGTAPPLLLAAAELLPRYAAHNPPAARRLAAAFWPGPLTLVLRRAPGFRGGSAGEAETVTLRIPAHEPLRGLLAAAGGALAVIGIPGAPTSRAARAALAVPPSLVIDGGTCPGGESSIVDCSRAPYRLLREGALARADLTRIGRLRLS